MSKEVWLVWVNDMVVEVFDSPSKAYTCAQNVRHRSPGLWTKSVMGQRWWQETGAIARLEIQRRTVR